MRVLFATPFLPRDIVSVERFILGKESLSGSQGSFLLVADALAKRGHEVGLWVAGGQQVTDSKIVNFRNLADALSASWTRIVLASWEDTETYNELRKAQITPLLWTQVHVPRNTLLQLEADSLAGIVVVSDAARLSLLHSSHHQQIGRVYNPLNPFFQITATSPANRYSSKAIVFCGYLGETKGAHLVLQMWPILKN